MNFSQPIAVVGIGGIFPGALDLETFWNNVKNAKSASREMPENRWILPKEKIYAPYQPSGVELDKLYSTRGCFVDDFSITEYIDVDRYNLDPSFINTLDPVFHHTLLAGIRAFEDAKMQNVNPERVGVIIGNIALPTQKASNLSWQILGKTLLEQLPFELSGEEFPEINPLNRYLACLPAGILAKALNLGGGTFTLDAACASSLYAIKLAADELLQGRADAVLGGGVARPDSLYTQVGFSQLRALSPDGVCAPFDQKANGLVIGEGAGIVVLKRLEDAVKHKDKIYAVITGIGLSNDRAGNLLAPSTAGQLRCMREAYRQAGWQPNDVDLIECHGTGTPVGDEVEIRSLKKLWEGIDYKPGQCAIGSVKSNVGHLLTGAGAAGFIKILLAMKEKTLPPTANFSSPSEKFEMENSPFRVLSEPEKWRYREKGKPLRAAVSAFGFGGINAHVLLEEWIPPKKSETESLPVECAPGTVEPIAVIGIDAHVGPFEDFDSFRTRVLGESESSTPETRENWFGVENSSWFKKKYNGEVPFKGYPVNEISVSPGQFKIPPSELRQVLPQQLLMLKVASGALEDAGYKDIDHLHTGVFVGISFDMNATNFHLRWTVRNKVASWLEKAGIKLSPREMEQWEKQLEDAVGPPLNADRTIGSLGSIVASRIAREYKVGGPSFTVSSSRTSSLKSLEVAVRRLQNGEINLGIVGGVDLAGDIRHLISQAGHRLNHNSNNSNVTTFGEGAAAVVVKRLRDAERDGDKIYAVIRGIGTASGGDIEKLFPPMNVIKQSAKKACLEADISPSSINYLELNDSSYTSEDKTESEALSSFYSRDDKNPCAVSSSKPYVGQTGMASGIVSFVKACSSLYHRILPPFKSSEEIKAQFEDKGFYTPVHTQPWLRDRANGPRRAAVNCPGIDGNCIHVILEEYENNEAPDVSVSPFDPPESLFCVFGDDEEEIINQLGALVEKAENSDRSSLSAFARQWFDETTGEKVSKKLSASFISKNVRQLQKQTEKLANFIRQNPEVAVEGNRKDLFFELEPGRIFYTPDPLGPRAKIAMVYPGSGNHYPGMGRKISLYFPHVIQKHDRENLYLRSQVMPEHFYNRDNLEYLKNCHAELMMGQVAYGAVISDLLFDLNLQAEAVIGYSLGESAGLFGTRAWKDRDLMLQRLNESSLFKQDLGYPFRAAKIAWELPPGQDVDWCVALIDQPAEKTRRLVEDFPRVYLMIENTPSQCVIGGQRQQVMKFINQLQCSFLELPGVTIAHCDVVDVVREKYRDFHKFEADPPRNLSYYSTALAEKYNVTTRGAADNITLQCLDTISFPNVINSAYKDGIRIFVEVGPKASCTWMINKILNGRPHLARSASSPGFDELFTFLQLIAHLNAHRVKLNLEPVYRVGDKPIKVSTEKTSKLPPITISTGKKQFNIPPLPRRGEPTAQPEIPVLQGEYSHDLSPGKGYSNEPATLTLPGGQVIQLESVIRGFEESWETSARAHQAYLELSDKIAREISRSTSFIIQMAAQSGEIFSETGQLVEMPSIPIPAEYDQPKTVRSRTAVAPPPSEIEKAKTPILDRDMCLEFAVGSIEKALGPEFAQIDTFPTRVRLPDEPLMLVDRILEIEGKPLSLTSGRVVTEHDVLSDAWYLDSGRIPTCIAVESGQADLFLSGYLGIDMVTRGLAVYRLLDAVVTFHKPLPEPGKVIRHDIRIERFFQQGGTYLFKFNFDSTIDGELFMTMRDGCAGFFTHRELEEGRGIIKTTLDKRPQSGKLPDDWVYPVKMGIEAYNDNQIDRLREGDLAACFGPTFEDLPISDPLTIPGGRMKLIDRVLHVDPEGGRYNLGVIKAQADIKPDHWFLTCHFQDDNVMPGTLMYECCLHTLRVFLLRMGWVGEKNQTVWEPIPGVASKLKCRGQVIETTKTAEYEIHVKEMGYDPCPFAIADALMFADGKPIVEITDMTVKLSGASKESILTMWERHRENKKLTQKLNSPPKPPVYDRESILNFAVGRPSRAFGEKYKIFDESRFIARLPGPPFSFIDRITKVEAPPFELKPGGTVEAQYDVPGDAWYFDENRQDFMPFAVLLEIALQPCGWLAAYMGSALTSQRDLLFRNLGGCAVQYNPVIRNARTLTTRVQIKKISQSGDMIIQNYNFEVVGSGKYFYKGDTYFGFFTRKALARQVGIRDFPSRNLHEGEIGKGRKFEYPTGKPFPGQMLRMIDRVDLYLPDGGPNKLGYVRGSKRVDPKSWFFKAHFYQDPVIPGSLGLESLLQLLKVLAQKRWGIQERETMLAVAPGVEHCWIYRGQVIPSNREVKVETWLTSVDDMHKIMFADGLLSVDGLVIYSMKDFSLRMWDS